MQKGKHTCNVETVRSGNETRTDTIRDLRRGNSFIHANRGRWHVSIDWKLPNCMVNERRPSPISGVENGLSPRLGMSEQHGLFPKRISTIYPGPPNGAHIEFVCEVSEGGTYYCKSDKSGRSVRATELFCTRFADHLGVATADAAVVEDEIGRSFFGSRHDISTATDTRLSAFLTESHLNELGQPADWPGRHLSQLYALDMLLANPDRDLRNFVLAVEGSMMRLRAIDFAAAELSHLADCQFPIAQSRTVLVGKMLRDRHGFFVDSALEMVDRIEAVPRDVIAGFVGEIPSEWLTQARREEICETWSSQPYRERIKALRAGLKDGTLL